ncbi:MAG: hypothetical protein NDI60_09065 [Elusimicrobiales bacterium]|nr:hypothetical protein [Elusimicrobiales bacterium]
MNFTRLRIVLAVLLLLAAAGGAFSYFKYRKISTYLIDQIGGQAGKKLGREVKFSGVAFSPLKGIVIRDVCVSRPPDFSRGNFFCAKKAVIRPQLTALLRNRVYFSKVAFESPVLKVREKGGRWDFEDLLALLPETQKGLYLTWNASEVELENAELQADLETSGLSLALEGADLRLEHYSALGGNYGLSAEGTLKSAVKGKLLAAEVELEADGNFDYAGLASTKGDLKITGASYGEITLESLKAGWALFNIRKPLADRNYSVSFQAERLTVPANGNKIRDQVAEGLKLFSAAMGKAAPRIEDMEMSSLSFSLNLDDSVLSLKDLALRSNFLNLDAGLAINGPAKTADAALKAAIGANELEMSAAGPMAEPRIKPLLSATLSSRFKAALANVEQELLRIFPVTGDK